MLYSRVKMIGEVGIEIFDKKLYLQAMEILKGGNKKKADRVLKKARKKQFKENQLGTFLRERTGKVIKNKLTGKWTSDPIVRKNLITTKGKEIMIKQLIGTTTTPIVGIAIGTGTVAPTAANTALGNEYERAAAVVNVSTTTTTNDSVVFSKSFEFTEAVSITEEGLFDHATTGGNLFARHTFSSYDVDDQDILTITHKIRITV